MQKQNDLAINLMNLFEPSSYKEFQKGYMVNKPEMEGYYYIFKNIIKPKFCLILNINPDFLYPTNMAKIRDYVFIIFNVKSLEDFLNELPDKYFVQILDVLDNELQKKNERNLPYGYYYDENGELQVDIKKADEVRRIYNMYLETGSIRDIAAELRTNFSHIREVLHDNEAYAQMSNTIVSLSKLKQVAQMMAENIRGGAVAKRTIEDEIADARRRRKERNKNLQQ